MDFENQHAVPPKTDGISRSKNKGREATHAMPTLSNRQMTVKWGHEKERNSQSQNATAATAESISANVDCCVDVNADAAPVDTVRPADVVAVPEPDGDAPPETEPVPLVYGACVFDGEPEELFAPDEDPTWLEVGVAIVDGFVTIEAGALVTELDGGVWWSRIEP